MFASCADNLCINSWPPELLQETGEFNPQKKCEITHLSWCNDNTYMAILQKGEKPQILSTKNLNNIRTVHTVLLKGDNVCSSVSFKKNTKKHLAIGMRNGEIFIYDTKSRSVAKNFDNLHGDCPVENLEFNYDDLQLAAGYDKIVTIFNNENVEELKHNSKCSCLKYHPYFSNKLAVGTSSGYVQIWDTKTCTSLFKNQLHSQNVTGVIQSRCGNFLISSGKDHKICLTDLNSDETQFRINLNRPINTIDLNYDDKIIAVGLEDGTVYLYDINFTVQPLICTKLHDHGVNKISFANFINDYESSISNFTISETKFEKNDDGDKICSIQNKMEKIKQKIMDRIEIKITDELENQFKEHCRKFHGFFNNEFKMINEIMKDKWDVFGNDDLCQVLHESESEYSESKI